MTQWRLQCLLWAMGVGPLSFRAALAPGWTRLWQTNKMKRSFWYNASWHFHQTSLISITVTPGKVSIEYGFATTGLYSSLCLFEWRRKSFSSFKIALIDVAVVWCDRDTVPTGHTSCYEREPDDHHERRTKTETWHSASGCHGSTTVISRKFLST